MIIVLDIETQEVIPANRMVSDLRISFAGVHLEGSARIFSEEELAQLFALLDNAELIVGHNLLLFDYKVLQRYAAFDVTQRYTGKTFDIFHTLLRQTDRQIGLNDLAQRNLGIQKLGAGIDAPRLFQEGKHAELQEYLKQDLAITAALFDHICAHGKLKYGHVVYKEPVEREITIVPPFVPQTRHLSV